MHPVLNGPGPFAYLFRFVLRARTARFTNAEIELSSKCPLPLLLKNTTHHVTFASSSCYEAARYGIPSLVLYPKGSGLLFADLHREGYVFFGTDSFTVEGWILSSKKTPARLRNKFGKPLDSHLELLGL
jgi:hypothetical protein